MPLASPAWGTFCSCKYICRACPRAPIIPPAPWFFYNLDLLWGWHTHPCHAHFHIGFTSKRALVASSGKVTAPPLRVLALRGQFPGNCSWVHLGHSLCPWVMYWVCECPLSPRWTEVLPRCLPTSNNNGWKRLHHLNLPEVALIGSTLEGSGWGRGEN